MKLTTKRNWAYFFRELFLYLIPMILIVGSIDTFFSYVQCLPHIEWSMPCSGIFMIKGLFYGIILVIAIFGYIISANRLKKMKKQIEKDFIESVNKVQDNTQNMESKNASNITSKKVIVKRSTTKKTPQASTTKIAKPKKSSSQKKSKK